MQVTARKIEQFTTELLLKTADIIVKRFVKNGSITYDSFEDYKQTIVEKYLLKKEKIEKAYTGQAKPATYISAILYRMVLEVLRKENNTKKNQKKNVEEFFLSNNKTVINPEEQLIINNEKEYLGKVLTTLGKDRFKAILFLKYYFRMNISINELQDYVPLNLINKAHELLKFEGNIKDKDVYRKLCEICNSFEEKKIKQDTVRMFINKIIAKIINRLNANKRAFYTKDTLLTLFELYYS